MKTTQEKKPKKSTNKRVTKRNPLGAGRKWFDGKDEKAVIAKLEQATALDASVGECLFYAGITKDSYYRYLKANPDFAMNLERLREKPVLKARETIIKALDETSNAHWYLERKRKAEFSTRQELTGKDGDKLIALSEIEKDTKALLDQGLDTNGKDKK